MTKPIMDVWVERSFNGYVLNIAVNNARPVKHLFRTLAMAKKRAAEAKKRYAAAGYFIRRDL